MPPRASGQRFWAILLISLCITSEHVASDIGVSSWLRSNRSSTQQFDARIIPLCTDMMPLRALLCNISSSVASSTIISDNVKSAVQALSHLPVVADWTAFAWESGLFRGIVSGGTPSRIGKVVLNKVLAPVVNNFITTNTGSFLADHILGTVPGFSRAATLLLKSGSGVDLGNVLAYLNAETVQSAVDVVLSEIARTNARLTVTDLTRDGLMLMHDIVQQASIALESEVDVIRTDLNVSDADVLALKPFLDSLGNLLDWAVRVIHEPFGVQGARFKDLFRVANAYGSQHRRLQQINPSENVSALAGDGTTVEDFFSAVGGVVGWLAGQWSISVEPLLNTLLDVNADIEQRHEVARTVAATLNTMREALMSSLLGPYFLVPLSDQGIFDGFNKEFTVSGVLEAIEDVQHDPGRVADVLIDTVLKIISSDVAASIPLEVFVNQGYVLAVTVVSILSSSNPQPPMSPRPDWNDTNDPCSLCQGCLTTLAPVLLSNSLSLTERTAFLQYYCRQNVGHFNVSSGVCSNLTALLGAAMYPYSRLRVGLVCSRMGLCPVSRCPNLTSIRIDYPWRPFSGPLDLCTAEGVAGGSPTLLPYFETYPGACLEGSSCGQSYACDLKRYGGRLCECQAGVDICTNYGMCEDYCSKNTTQAELAQRNAADIITTCSAEYPYCPMGYRCNLSTNCTFWACNARNQALYQQSCSGLCMPVPPTMVMALLAFDGSIDIVLSTAAAPLNRQPCDLAFEPATVERLGGAACTFSSDNFHLGVYPGPNATIGVGQVLTLLSVGTALKEQQGIRTFSGSVEVRPAGSGDSSTCSDIRSRSLVPALLCNLMYAAGRLQGIDIGLRAGAQAVRQLPSIVDWSISQWGADSFKDILSSLPASIGRALLENVLKPVAQEFVKTNTGSFITDHLLASVPEFARTLTLLFTPGSGVGLGDVAAYLDTGALQAIVDSVLAEIAHPHGRITLEEVARDGLASLHNFIREAVDVLESEGDTLQLAFRIDESDMHILNPFVGSVVQFLDWALRLIHGVNPDSHWPEDNDLFVVTDAYHDHDRRVQQFNGPDPKSQSLATSSIWVTGGANPLPQPSPSGDSILLAFGDLLSWMAEQWGTTVEPVLRALLDENAGYQTRVDAATAVASAANAVVDAFMSTEVGKELAEALDEAAILRYGSKVTADNVLKADTELRYNPGRAIAVAVQKAAMILSSDRVTSIPAGIIIRDGFTLLRDLAEVLFDGVGKPQPPPYNACVACQSCIATLNIRYSEDFTPDRLTAAVNTICEGNQRSNYGGMNRETCGRITTIATSQRYSDAFRAGYLCASLGQCSVSSVCPSITAPRIDGSGPVLGPLDVCTVEGVAGGTRNWNPLVVPCNVSMQPSSCSEGYTCAPVPECHQYWTCGNAGNTSLHGMQQCNGLCLRLQPFMTEAWFLNEARSINVTLSVPAAPLALQPCGRVFDPPTVAMLGDSLCSAVNSTLYVNLTAWATIRANDTLTLRNGTTLVDKFSNRSFSGSVMVRVLPRPPYPPGNDTNSSEPCSGCQFCLATLRPLLYSIPLTKQRSEAFLTFCQQHGDLLNVSGQTCKGIVSQVQASFTNGGPRIGYLCSRIGLCPSSGCSNLQATRLDGSYPFTGPIDLCTAEGVVGGTYTLPAAAQPLMGSCTSDSNCIQGKNCDFDTGRARICECRSGEDVCTDYGMCVDFCTKYETTLELEERNSGAVICNASSSLQTACLDGYECVRDVNCTLWACDSTKQLLYRQTCSGLCMPLKLSMERAWLGNDGQSIGVALSIQAEPLSREPCNRIFDATTAALLGGAASRCTAAGNLLTIFLAPAATIQAGQKLNLLETGTILTSKINNSRAFSGSVVVQNCSGCLAPKADIMGPSVIAAPCSLDNSSSSASRPSSSDFDASLSTDASGRALTDVEWAVLSSPESSRAVLQAAVQRTNTLGSLRERAVLSLSATEVARLEDSESYSLQVTIRSWLGTSASAEVSFAKISAAIAPAIQISGPKNQTLKIKAGIRLSAAATTVCQGRAIVWNWTEVNPSDVRILPEGGVAGQNLFVKGPVSIQHNQNITLRVAARYANNPQGDAASEVYAYVTLFAQGSSPVARLVAPSGDVLDNITLVFNATGSLNSDDLSSTQSLQFTWKCRRKDGDPCFMTSNRGNQTAIPGVWTLPPGLLETGTWYIFSVTVISPTGLEAQASVEIRPRAAAQPFPKGKLMRACSLLSCMAPHSTDDPLVVSLLLDSDSRSANVSWHCDDIPSLQLALGTEASQTSAVRTISIPATVLPTMVLSITIVAHLILGDVTGIATLAVELNSAPYCRVNATSPVECLIVDVQNDTAPDALVVVRAEGWEDTQDQQLRYEFGFHDSESSFAQMRERGTAASARMEGLPVGYIEIYGCAIDSQNARSCVSRTVGVNPPPSDYNAEAVLESIDVNSLAQANNWNALLGTMDRMSSLIDIMASSNATNSSTGLVAQKSTAIVAAVMQSLTSVLDFEEVMQAMSSLACFAGSAASMLSDDARSVFADAAEMAVKALNASSVGDLQSSLTDICRLLGVSLPQSNGNKMPSSAKVTVSNRAASASAKGSAIADARESLLQVTSLGNQLGIILGQEATPDAGFLTAGNQGVYVAAAVMPTSITELGAGRVTLAAGPTAGSTIGSRRSVKEAVGVDALNIGGRRQLRVADNLASGNRSSRLLLAISNDAAAQLIVNGTAAMSVSGYTVVLQHASSSNTAITVATTGVMSNTWSVIGGLVTVSWKAPATLTGAAPVLSGDTYILLTLPTPNYSSARSTTCLLYDALASTISDQAGSFVSYDSTSGRVTCHVTKLGSYFVAQGPLLSTPSPSSAGPLLSTPSPSPAGPLLSTPSPSPAATKTIIISLWMRLSSASKLSTNEQKNAFISGLQAALADIYQIPPNAVNVYSLSDVRPDNTVLAMVELTVPASQAEDSGSVTGFKGDPKSKLPSNFIYQFGIEEVSVKQGEVTIAIEDSDDDDVPVGIIAGAVVGGTVGLLMVIVIVLLIARRRRAQQAAPFPSGREEVRPAPPSSFSQSAVPPGNPGNDPYQVPITSVRPYSRG